jgi:hypothetical protein
VDKEINKFAKEGPAKQKASNARPATFVNGEPLIVNKKRITGLWHAAVTKDGAQHRRWIFCKAVR